MFPSDSNSWTWHGPLFFPSWIHFGAFNSQPTNLTPRGQKYLVIPIAMQSNVHFCLFAQDFIVGKFIYCVVCRVNKQTRPYITCYIFYIINVFRSFNMLKLWSIIPLVNPRIHVLKCATFTFFSPSSLKKPLFLVAITLCCTWFRVLLLLWFIFILFIASFTFVLTWSSLKQFKAAKREPFPESWSAG
jgi:hypothetical protein